MAKAPTFHILLVEDSPDDIFFTREALKELDTPYHLSVTRNGVEAISFLRNPIETALGQPDIIFLDLNLPRLSGCEVLKEIKSDPNLMLIPVIILSTSEADQDIREAYRLHANSYIVKPMDFKHFVAAIKSIEIFWFKTVKLPLPA